MRINKLGALLLIVTSAVLAVVVSAAKSPSATSTPRGELLAADCHTCHSPKTFGPQGPQPDPQRLFAGSPAEAKLPDIPKDQIAPQKWGGLFSNDLTAWVGPWGVSYGANLTPDKETGIGNWTFDLFKEVMRSGMYHDGSRHMLPPMPSEGWHWLSDEDLKAMFDYFMSLKPVSNKVPNPIPPDKLGMLPPGPPKK